MGCCCLMLPRNRNSQAFNQMSNAGVSTYRRILCEKEGEMSVHTFSKSLGKHIAYALLITATGCVCVQICQ